MLKEGSSGNRWFFKEHLAEWFFVKPKMVLLWHRLMNLLKHLYFQECNIKCNHVVQNNHNQNGPDSFVLWDDRAAPVSATCARWV